MTNDGNDGGDAAGETTSRGPWGERYGTPGKGSSGNQGNGRRVRVARVRARDQLSVAGAACPVFANDSRPSRVSRPSFRRRT